MANKSVIGIALCSLGRMGSIHLHNILMNKQVILLYVIEADLEKCQKIISSLSMEDASNIKVLHADSCNEAFSDERVNAFVIATPTHTHGSLVQKALSAGKHVLCEKPLAVSLKAAMDSYKLAKSNGLVLLCAFNRRFDPQIRELVNRKRDVGKLQTIRLCSRDAPRPLISYLQISGGIFHDCLVHDLDLMRWIVEENPETIYCIAHCHDPEIAALNDVDTVIVTLKFPSGVLAVVELQRECAFGYDQTLEIYGTKGNIISSNPRKSSIIFNGGQVCDEIHDSFSGRYAASYICELEHLIELIQKKETTPRILDSDTLYATMLCQAAEDSWKEGRVIDVKSYIEKQRRENGW